MAAPGPLYRTLHGSVPGRCFAYGGGYVSPARARWGGGLEQDSDASCSPSPDGGRGGGVVAGLHGSDAPRLVFTEVALWRAVLGCRGPLLRPGELRPRRCSAALHGGAAVPPWW